MSDDAHIAQNDAMRYAVDRCLRDKAPMTVWADHSAPDAWGRSRYYVRSDAEGKPTEAAVLVKRFDPQAWMSRDL